MCCFSFNLHFPQSLLKSKIFIIKIHKYLLSYFWSKMLSSSLYAKLKLYPQKLFPSYYITLYGCIKYISLNGWMHVHCTVWCNQIGTVWINTFWEALTSKLMISSQFWKDLLVHICLAYVIISSVYVETRGS